MPRLSYFYGIGIYLYYEDHSPAHIHARYAGHEAKIAISDGRVLEGELPRRAGRLVAEWIARHSAELEECWRRALSGEPPVLSTRCLRSKTWTSTK